MESSKTKKIVFYVIGGLIGIVIVAGITLVVLNALVPNHKTDNTAVTQPTLKEVDTPEKLVADYTSAKIESRDSLYTKRELLKESTISEPQQKNVAVAQGPTNSIVSYQKQDRFAVQISSSDYVQYQRKDVSTAMNDATLIEKTEAYLTAKGLVKTTTQKLGNEATNTTYDSKNVVCQISDVLAFARQASTYGIACVTKQVIDSQYTYIDSLVKLVPNFDVKTAKTITSSPPIVKGTKQLVLLTVSAVDKAEYFYFATLDKDWEYLGQRTITNPDDTEGFKLPDELKKNISDAKWGTFLTDNIK